VRLNFEPSGRAVGEVGEYYRSIKENRCVVCGKDENLIRKNVVPREYRKFFPNVMKDKTSHDILLLCINCHQRSNIADLKMRQILQTKCDAPLNGDVSEEDLTATKELKNQQRIARALFKGEKIPEPRKEELRILLQKSFPNQEITEEFLRNLLSKEAQNSNPNTTSHGEIVVQQFKETEGLVHLEKLWRQHFLDCMQPKFMPQLWNVNHNGNRLEIRATEGKVEAEDLKLSGVDAVIYAESRAENRRDIADR
jgi:exonuclease 3'-5' domain-containing protein 2